LQDEASANVVFEHAGRVEGESGGGRQNEEENGGREDQGGGEEEKSEAWETD